MSFGLRSTASLLRPISTASALKPRMQCVFLTPASFLSLQTAHKSKQQVYTPLSIQSQSLSTQAPKPVVNRPISPHVTIYAWPLPAISSIAHRVTGVALTTGVVGMAFVALAGGCDIPSYVESFKVAAPMAVPIAKMAVAYPVVYHTLAGLRHLYWDKTAKNLDLPSVVLSSQVILASASVISIALGFYSIPALQ